MVTMPVPKGFYVTSRFGPRAGGYHWGTDYGAVSYTHLTLPTICSV